MKNLLSETIFFLFVMFSFLDGDYHLMKSHHKMIVSNYICVWQINFEISSFPFWIKNNKKNYVCNIMFKVCVLMCFFLTFFSSHLCFPFLVHVTIVYLLASHRWIPSNNVSIKKVDLPEIKGSHRKFRSIVSSIIGMKGSGI